MGCSGSKGEAPKPPAPKDSPDDWGVQAEAVFKLLDKDGAGHISTVPHKKRDDYASEITVLGEDVLAKQLEAGDFKLNDKVTITEWKGIIREKVEEKDWPTVRALFEAITKAVNDEAQGGWEQLARNVFKGLDSKWCEPADTGSVAVPKECKEIGDKTDEKCATILAGLEEETKITCDEWVAHVKTKVCSLVTHARHHP